MHDEGTTTAVDMIDNTCLGHRYINNEFGQSALPSVTWSIDPFGHSSTQASLLSSPSSGFSALFVSRADYSDIQARTANKSLEYIWTPSFSLGPDASTFFSIMNSGLHLYFPLPGLCWDIVNCNDPEIQDDATLDDYNVDDVVNRIVSAAKGQAQNYVGDIYFTQGFDFNYEYAEEWFSNLDKAIHYTNLLTHVHGVNLFYSTPQFYASTKIDYPYSWPLKTPSDGDGFPYADGPHSYWTGYLSSRSALKGYIRTSSNSFQALKQIQATVGPFNVSELDSANPILELRRAMAVVQHHDAVAGTSMQHVALDYARRISRGLKGADSIWGGLFGDGQSGIIGQSCDLANASICKVFESLSSTPITLAIYNSKSQSLLGTPVQIPVSFVPGVASYSVSLSTASGMQPVVSQLVPLSAADLSLRDYYSFTPSQGVTSTSWLVFLATINSTAPSYYTITPSSTVEASPLTFSSKVHSGGIRDEMGGIRDEMGALLITNGDVTLTFDNVTQMISSFSSKSLGITSMPLIQSFFFYNSSTGNEVDSQSGGAYIMRPNSTTIFPIDFSTAPAIEFVTGPIVNEARLSLPWFFVTNRLWQNQVTFDTDYTVGPVPIADGMGKEIIARMLAPTFSTAGTWKSDSNCRDMITRVRNFRPSWNATIVEPIAGNFAPVTCAIETTDNAQGMTLFIANDRAQSGGSIVDGSVELLIQRRLLADDQRGVGEPLNETGITGNGIMIRGLHRIGLAPVAGGVAAALRRSAILDVSLSPPIHRFCIDGQGCLPVSTGGSLGPSVLQQDLPPNLHLLTFQHVGPSNSGSSYGSVLVRLAHLFEVNEHPTLSQNVTVDLGSITKVSLINCTEMTLPGAQPLSSAQRTTFRYVSSNGEEASVTAPSIVESESSSNLVTLSPMQVRTWVCDR
jgi:alpha-mannosidase